MNANFAQMNRDDPTLTAQANIRTKLRGSNDNEYQIYISCADNGRGGDITRDGAPLLAYDEWLNA